MTSHLEALAKAAIKRSIFTRLAQVTERLLSSLADLGLNSTSPTLRYDEEVISRKVDMFVISQYQQYMGSNEIMLMLEGVGELLKDETTILNILAACVRDRPPPEATRKIRSRFKVGVPEARLIYELVVELTRPVQVTGATIVG